MKGKILFAEYNEETGISTVCKQTKYGTFTKTVKVAEEDRDIANKYDGCYFAEMKCDLAAYKRRAQNMEERAKGAQHLVNVFCSGWQYDMDAEPFLLDLVDNAWREAARARETYYLLKDSYYALVENTLRQRRELRERIAKRRNQNQ